MDCIQILVLSPETTSILKVLAYFNIFQYPVTAEEICRYADRSFDTNELQPLLDELCGKACIFNLDGFYALENNTTLVRKRISGNQHAQQLLPTAYRIGRFLQKFPFVRAVGISGSLSKNVADENADIDFFIITAPNRLWIARTLMHAFKKLTFLAGKQHWYCMNYYIDESALTIAEKNIFTATEVVTVLPVRGEAVFNNFFSANAWAYAYYPNTRLQGDVAEKGLPQTRQDKITEVLFNNRFGNWLDDYWMNLTTNRWVQKEKKHRLNIKGDPMGLKTGKHFARPNPDYFQKKILTSYHKTLEELEAKWHIRF